MSKSKFLEGAIIGFLAGFVGAVWLLNDEDDAIANDVEDSNGLETSSKKKKPSPVNKTVESTEEVVSKTMDAIEKGFDKISKMIDEKKSKK
jgi:hypothetical protein